MSTLIYTRKQCAMLLENRNGKIYCKGAKSIAKTPLNTLIDTSLERTKKVTVVTL